MDLQDTGPAAVSNETMASILSGVHDRSQSMSPQKDTKPQRWPATSDSDSIELDDHCIASPANISVLPIFLDQADRLPESLTVHAPSARGLAASPMERFWVEPQRHERIAFMMTGRESDTDAAHPTSRRPPPATHNKHAKRKLASSNERNLPPASPPERSPSPGFCSGLVVDPGAGGMDDEPDLEAIKIAARIKSEQIYRGGQRQCRLGRVRKKICRTKRPEAKDPG